MPLRTNNSQVVDMFVRVLHITGRILTLIGKVIAQGHNARLWETGTQEKSTSLYSVLNTWSLNPGDDQ